MFRPRPSVLLIGVVGLASCSGSRDQEQIAQLQAEVAELRQAIQSQQDARDAPLPAAHDDHAPADHSHRGPAGHADHAPAGHEDHTPSRHGEDPADAGQVFVRPTGKVIGVIQGIRDSGGPHINVSLLSPGEERPRDYFVHNQPDILAAVRTGKVGDRVEIGWVQTNHGPAIETFEVLE